MFNYILRRLRNAVGMKRTEKMENQGLVSPSRQCSSTPVGFGKEFIVNNIVTSRYITPTVLTWL
jgi:hypothetical protein